MGKERIEKEMILMNSVQDILEKRHATLTFEDDEGNRYQYGFFGHLTEKEKNKFFQMIKDYEYLPSAEKRHAKPTVLVAFRQFDARYNPLTGRYTYKMANPVFKRKVVKENPARERVVYRKKFCQQSDA